MRVFKFRAWNKKYKKWVTPEGRSLFFPYAVGLEKGWESTLALFGFQSDSRIGWMQYTGLKDKNGKEIYEGDILSVAPTGEFVEWFVVVTWDEVEAQFRVVHEEKGNGRIWNFDHFDIWEVIGNIWENPDLIESEVNK